MNDGVHVEQGGHLCLNRPGFRGGRLVLACLRYVIERINDCPVNRTAELLP